VPNWKVLGPDGLCLYRKYRSTIAPRKPVPTLSTLVLLTSIFLSSSVLPCLMSKPKKFHRNPGFQFRAQTLDALDSLLGAQTRPRRRSRERHKRRCTVCRHPDRQAIEDAFLHWQSPEKIAREFGIADHSTVYRHAHANGLFSRRNAFVCSALDTIIEHASTVKVTGKDVINAIRTAACLTDDGKWIEPPKKYIYTTETVSEPASKISMDTAPSSLAASQNPNSQPRRLDHDATL
jgi:hypothetical protein